MPVTPLLWEVEVEGSEVQCYLGLHSKFEANLDYMRPYLQRRRKKEEKKEEEEEKNYDFF